MDELTKEIRESYIESKAALELDLKTARIYYAARFDFWLTQRDLIVLNETLSSGVN